MKRLLALLLLFASALAPLPGQAQDGGDRPLLDVSIAIFDPNLPTDSRVQQQQGIYPAVRQAEARYLPSFLKLTLEDSGQWGAVRLLPATDSGAELQVTATILRSDGSQLDLAVKAVDATGRIWTDREYTGSAVESVSLNQPVLGTDPFLYLYRELLADLGAVYQSLTNAQLAEIRAVSTLRYGAALAPDVFTPYLDQDDDGRYRLLRFPADNDPFLSRVREIREHEYVFIDVVDDQYEDFFVTIKPVYDLWRSYRREQQTSEADKVRRENEQGRQFRRGSYMALRESYNNFRWARLQDQYLDEINEGFTNEVLPTDITLEDSIFHLTGTLDEQYEEWKGILQELYQLEQPGADH